MNESSTIPALPIAAIKMSASRAIAARSLVLEWQIVTVAWRCRSNKAIGSPTSRLMLNEPGLRPCTPAGIIEMLKRYEIDIKSAQAVVIGRSRLVGLPLALLLLPRPRIG